MRSCKKSWEKETSGEHKQLSRKRSVKGTAKVFADLNKLHKSFKTPQPPTPKGFHYRECSCCKHYIVCLVIQSVTRNQDKPSKLWQLLRGEASRKSQACLWRCARRKHRWQCHVPEILTLTLCGNWPVSVCLSF